MNPSDIAEHAVPAPGVRDFVEPFAGQRITSEHTGNTYEIQTKIGEGNFGIAYHCVDVWGNDLAAKVLKPRDTYEAVLASAVSEFEKLLILRHPNVTYVYDAFEVSNTCYIVTERCYGPITRLFELDPFAGHLWLIPIARCLLQAIHYLHLNQYAHQDIHAGNLLIAFARNEMDPTEQRGINFKLCDLGVSKVFGELDALNTLNDSIRPPEAIDPDQFGPLDHRIDIYQTALLLLQIAYSKQLSFSRQQVMDGYPRELALKLPAPLNFALEKALRRHVAYRTETAMELWRDLKSEVRLPDPQMSFPGLESDGNDAES